MSADWQGQVDDPVINARFQQAILDTINERLDLRTAHFQTQIDCCQVKRPIRDVLWALFAAFVLGYIFAPGISQLF